MASSVTPPHNPIIKLVDPGPPAQVISAPLIDFIVLTSVVPLPRTWRTVGQILDTNLNAVS
jgi:hypothetical protein